MKSRIIIAGIMAGSFLLGAGCAHSVANRQADCISIEAESEVKVISDTMEIDEETGTFTAKGADCISNAKVISDTMEFDEETGTFIAEGNVKVTTTDGSIIQAEKVIITPGNKPE